MSTTLTVWRVHLRSLRNAACYDRRMQVALGVGLALTVVVGLWSATQLSVRLQQWHTQGPGAVDAGLWSLCWLTWGGMGAFTILGSIQRALSDDESLLMFCLPIAPSTRFRTLYGSFFIENLWSWLFLEMGVTGYVLVSVLGWHALVWLVLLQLGVGVAVLCTLIAVLLVIHYLMPRERVKTRLGVAVALGLLAILIAIGLFGLRGIGLPGQPRGPSPLHSTPLAPTGSTHRLAILLPRFPGIFALWVTPEFVIVLFALLLVVVLGPFAAAAGRLYVAAFQTTQSWDRSRKATTIPGIRALISLFARCRTLTGALFVKMLLSQSRNFAAWMRMGVVLLVMVLFPQIHAVAAHYGWLDRLFVAGFAAGLAILGVVEQAPNAISGEGNRLILYLSAPLDLATILRAKLMLFALPALVEGLAVGLFLAWRFGLSLGQTGFALIAIVLIVVGTMVIFVWGSAWDEDLSQMVEGAIQTMLQEEAPITPRRIWLLNLGIVFFVGMLLLLWKLPAMLALTALVLLDVGIVVGMWRFGCARLWRLVRKA